MNKSWSLLCSLGCCTLSNFWFSNSASAQISADGTTSTTVNNDGSGNFTIDQGDRAGNNLFHSFGDFSVPTNGSAFFNNATDISNIFSRVTGGNISNIDGLIRANGSANLFLVNPAGILFGNNARLDIGGSFLGTTSDSILFEDGQFSATDLDNPPLLTINAPIGLNFRDNPASIDTNSTASADFNPEPSFDDNLFGIRVPDGKTFALAGGDITADSGGIVAVGGRIELGAVVESGTVGLNFTGDNISFDFPDDLTRANVSLINNAGFLVSGSGGGDIAITANNIEILEGSGLFAGIFSGLGSPEAQAGDITLQASESILLDGITENNENALTGVFSRVNGTAGNGGNIDIKSKSIFLNNRGTIDNDISGEGNAGNIVINTDFLKISTSNITSSVFGKGNAGNIDINASESVEISGDILPDDGEFGSPGGILNQVERGGEGQGGNLTIETPLLNVSNGGKVQVATFGNGNPGNLSINATEINVFNTEDSNNQFATGIFAGVLIDPRNEQFARGEATNLTIDTEILSIRGGAEVSAETSGIGNGSNIFINATELVEIVGTDNKDGSPSIISADVGSSDLDTSVDIETITRNSGNITIDTNQLSIKDGGQISASNFTAGNAGNINIFSNSIILNNEGRIDAATQSETGEGANINLQVADNITLKNNSFISAQAFGNADGGNLTIHTNFIIAFPNETPGTGSDIIANATEGDGGNINITAESLLGIEERTANPGNETNDIDASSDFGLDGTISIFTPDTNIIQGVTELPNNVVEPSQTVAEACSNNRNTSVVSNFTIKGKGGVPPLPDAPMGSEIITVNGEVANNSNNSYAIPTSYGYIIPARGAIKTADGKIILTATPVSGSASRDAAGSLHCGS